MYFRIRQFVLPSLTLTKHLFNLCFHSHFYPIEYIYQGPKTEVWYLRSWARCAQWGGLVPTALENKWAWSLTMDDLFTNHTSCWFLHILMIELTEPRFFYWNPTNPPPLPSPITPTYLLCHGLAESTLSMSPTHVPRQTSSSRHWSL